MIHGYNLTVPPKYDERFALYMLEYLASLRGQTLAEGCADREFRNFILKNLGITIAPALNPENN